jgi:hypothetical protein
MRPEIFGEIHPEQNRGGAVDAAIFKSKAKAFWKSKPVLITWMVGGVAGAAWAGYELSKLPKLAGSTSISDGKETAMPNSGKNSANP